MKKKKTFSGIKEMGHLFFGVGMLLVLIFTWINPINTLKPTHALVLLLFGLIVGLMDVKREHSMHFLMAFLGLIITMGAPLNVITFYNIGAYLKAFLLNTAIFLTLAVIAVCFRIIYRIYKESSGF